MKVASIQIAPVFLDSTKTWSKLEQYIREAANEGAQLVTWGETLLPGYPLWLSPSGGAAFNDKDQKTAYGTYWQQSLRLDGPIVTEMRNLAQELGVMFMGGIGEQSSGSTYCTLLTIGKDGSIMGRHRKMKPTYEERLIWADGDGKGLVVYPTEIGNVGGLNCWENWLPLARAALHQQEEILHVAVWPGSWGLTKDISRFMALEGRSWIVSTSGLLRPTDFTHLDTAIFPMKSVMEEHSESWQNGGSVIIDPTGTIVAGPLIDEEGILYADIDPLLAIQERQNMDHSGHYSRPDIFSLVVNKR
ncbi:MAG: carbon-nitrogen hydrolase family protein [Candidatus Kariarchaeaceae archaeon]|jgi:nitrilase